MSRFVTNIIAKNKKLVLFIVNLLPAFLQNWLKNLYRFLLERAVSQAEIIRNNAPVYKDGCYNLKHQLTPELLIGVNIVGFPKGELGLGQQARNVALGFEAGSINYRFNDFSKYLVTSNNDNSASHLITNDNKYNTNIFSFNGDQVALFYNDYGIEPFKGRYNIHYGAWELRHYPDSWIYSFNVVDEFWAMSSFMQQSVADKATIPVVHMPYPIDFEIPTHITRRNFNLPEDKFLFIFTFDLASVSKRKNPEAVIKAFNIAFPNNDNVGLVIKVSRKKDRKTHNNELNDLLAQTAKDKRVYLIDEVLPREQILGLINCCDSYVSLHRAEGFGMGMAEAMKMKKVVIATNYSGNTDFTHPDNSCLVDYKLIDLKPGDYIYEQGQVWADANVEHAASHMKKIVEDQDLYRKIAANGQNYINENYNFKIIGERYKTRLKLLGLLD